MDNNIDYKKYIGYKEFTCPCCSQKFKDYVARKVKIRIIDSDIDLRPICEPIEPLYYDTLMCPKCGYTTLTMFIDNKLNTVQRNKIQEKITPFFKYTESTFNISKESVIQRYKMAILSHMIKNSNISEQAYICLKLAWVYRINEEKKKETDFLIKAVTGFEKAYTEEEFPLCGLDELTCEYLLGVIYSIIGQNDKSLKWLGKVIVSKQYGKEKLKDKAKDLKVSIQNKV